MRISKRQALGVRLIGIVCLALIIGACVTNQPQKISVSQQLKAVDNITLAIKYIQKGKSMAAKQKLMQALKHAPNYAPSWYAMAYYLEVTGNYADANKYYLKAISLAPKNGSTYNNYGTFLCRRAQYTDAIAQFVKAADLPKYLNAATAYENAAACALKIPNKKLAINLLTKAAKLDPSLKPIVLKLRQSFHKQS